MPSVGGGGHGSFSSSSFSSPSMTHGSSYVPTYYGYSNGLYYFRGTGRSFNIGGKIYRLLVLPIILFVISIGVFCASIPTMGEKYYQYDYEKVSEYCLAKYNEYYSPSSKNYEDNILVTILTSDTPDKDGYYYLSVVGDNVNRKVYDIFGSDDSFFGVSIHSVIDDDYTYSLDSDLAKVFSLVETKIDTLSLNNYFIDEVSSNSYNSLIEEKVDYIEFNNEEELSSVLNRIKNKTNIAITLLVLDSSVLFTREYNIIFYIVSGICLLLGIIILISRLYARKEFKKDVAANKIDEYGNPIKKEKQVDEFGMPIKKEKEVDEFGMPIKKKN